MKRTRILVAEDDAHIRDGLVDTMQSEGYEVVAVPDGTQALKRFAAGGLFDLLLLDIMMPGHSGYDVCREVRAKDRRVPIIMLTAKGGEIDKVLGLQLGADDYITKPFGVHELLARVAAVLRRAQPELAAAVPAPDTFAFGEVTVDAKRYEIARHGKRTPITDREVRLLQFFHGHPDEVVSRDKLLNAVWGVAYFGTTRTLDQHIAQLRKKVERHPDAPTAILTVHGVGYRYEPAKAR